MTGDPRAALLVTNVDLSYVANNLDPNRKSFGTKSIAGLKFTQKRFHKTLRHDTNKYSAFVGS